MNKIIVNNTNNQIDFKSSFNSIVISTFTNMLSKGSITAFEVTKVLRAQYPTEIISHPKVRSLIEQYYSLNNNTVYRNRVMIDPLKMAQAFLYSKTINNPTAVTTSIQTASVNVVPTKTLIITTFTKPTVVVPNTIVPVQPSTGAVQGQQPLNGPYTHLVDSEGRVLIHKKYLRQLGWGEALKLSYSYQECTDGTLILVENVPVSKDTPHAITVRVRQNLRFKAPKSVHIFEVTVLIDSLRIFFKNI